MERYRAVIVIPAYNEERTLPGVIKSVKKYGDVIVVNDASTDMTERVANNFGAIVVNHKINKGYDQALNSGFLKAHELNFDAVITFDADGQHSSDMLPIFLSKLSSGTDLVLGIRPKVQRFSELIFKLYTITRFNWSDPLCGMKGYSMKLYESMGCFNSFNSIGTELATYAIVNDFKYCKIKVPVFNRKDKPRFASIFRANLIILKALYLTWRK